MGFVHRLDHMLLMLNLVVVQQSIYSRVLLLGLHTSWPD